MPVRIAILVFLITTSMAAADWPHWRGPQRNDIVDEPSGWNGSEWRLTESWQANVGEGASSPLVIGDRVLVMGWSSGQEHLACLDSRSGKEIWRAGYEAPQYGRESTGDKGIYAAVSSTPEFDEQTGWIYSLGIDGDLRCWDLDENGAEVWSLNLYDRYQIGQRPDVGGKRGGASRRDYGYTTSPLVEGNTLIVEVGDTQSGTVKGYDKRTGEELWSSDCRDEAGHTGGPVPLNVDGIPCAVVLTMRNLIVVRLDAGHEGETLAEYPWTTDFANNIPTPAISGNRILVTTSYNQAAMVCLEVSRSGLREVWKQVNPSGVCSPVIHDGHVYWAWRGIHCVDFATGEELWMGPKVGTPGSCILTSDDKLIVLGDRGDLYLIETAASAPEAYTELAQKRLGFSSEAWPHVVLADARLYCRDRLGQLQCFHVGQR